MIWPFKRKPLHPAVDLVIRLLRNGRDWQRGSHYLSHPTGAVMWIANSDYGLSLSITPGAKPGPRNCGQGGDVSLDKRNTRALWRAVRDHLEGGDTTFSNETLTAFAQRIVDHYECQVIPFDRRAA